MKKCSLIAFEVLHSLCGKKIGNAILWKTVKSNGFHCVLDKGE